MINKQDFENKSEEMEEYLLDDSIAQSISEDDSTPEEIDARQVTCPKCDCKRIQLVIIEKDLVTRDSSLELLCLNCGTLFEFKITQDHFIQDPKRDRSYLG